MASKWLPVTVITLPPLHTHTHTHTVTQSQLITFYCLPVFLYAVNASLNCSLETIRSLEFVITCALMKLFCTSCISVIVDCQKCFPLVAYSRSYLVISIQGGPKKKLKTPVRLDFFINFRNKMSIKILYIRIIIRCVT